MDYECDNGGQGPTKCAKLVIHNQVQQFLTLFYKNLANYFVILIQESVTNFAQKLFSMYFEYLNLYMAE